MSFKNYQLMQVYADPGTWKKLEGLAILIKHHHKQDTVGAEYWTVAFTHARDIPVERWIHRRRGSGAFAG